MASDNDANPTVTPECGLPRKCLCDNCRIGERYTSDQCLECYQFHNNEVVNIRHSPCSGRRPDFDKMRNNLLAMGGIVLSQVVEIAKCVYRSEDKIRPSEAVNLKLGSIRDWYRCKLGMTKIPVGLPQVSGVVCPCAGCGPSCIKYQRGEIE